MNAAQIHLALNHLPLAGVIFGIVFLGFGWARGSVSGRTGGLWLLILSAGLSIPTYLSGEPAEEVIEHRTGVSEATIHEHEEAAEYAFILLLLTGAAAGAAVLTSKKRPVLSKRISLAALAMALLTGAATARTAHLGGLIRHDELGQKDAGGSDVGFRPYEISKPS